MKPIALNFPNKGEAAPMVGNVKPSEELVKLSVKLSTAEHRRLKIYLAGKGENGQEFIRACILEKLDRLGH